MHEEYFVRVMLDPGWIHTQRMEQKNKKNATEIWTLIWSRQIKNHLKHWKSRSTACKKLLSTNGFGWDHINKCLDVEDDASDEYRGEYSLFLFLAYRIVCVVL